MTTPAILWGSLGPDSTLIDTAFEAAVGKRESLVHLAQPWVIDQKYQSFPAAMLQVPWDRGQLALLDWANWDLTNQYDPAYSLDSIVSGKHDAYLHAWAQAAAAWGHPFVLRFDAEMNGSWSSYGNQPASFGAAWRYLHDLFVADGAVNVTWHWCPNVCAPAGTQWPTATDKLSTYYPGDAYVDWTGWDGYDFGEGTATLDASGKVISGYLTPRMTFSQVASGYPGWLGDTYGTIGTIAPTKPMLIGEFSSWAGPGQAAWFADALAVIPAKYPQVRGISVFNWAAGGGKWPLNAAALDAFKAGIARSPWVAGGTASLPSGKIIPYVVDARPDVPPVPVPAPLPAIPPSLTNRGATWDVVAASLASDLTVVNARLVATEQDSAQLASVRDHLAALLKVAQAGGSPGK